MSNEINLDDIRYSNNILTQVIIRIDLTSPLNEISTELPKDFNKTILKYFPIVEPKPAFIQNVKFTIKELSTSKTEFTEWNFYSTDRKKHFQITPQWFFISDKSYNEYEDLRTIFEEISNKYFETFEDAQANRIGLRYINNIRKDETTLFEWANYINQNLLGLFNNGFLNGNPSRIFHILEYLLENFNLRFQFGMSNPDYPDQIRKKEFVLDYDAYFQGLIDHQQVLAQLDEYHTEIQSMFENSITDTLRESMR